MQHMKTLPIGAVLAGYSFKRQNNSSENQNCRLTPKERYFLAYAYAWMVNTNKEALFNQIIIDVHRQNSELMDY